MYIAVTGSKNNKDVYIYQSFRKEKKKTVSPLPASTKSSGNIMLS